jgi:hypothetical protein
VTSSLIATEVDTRPDRQRVRAADSPDRIAVWIEVEKQGMFEARAIKDQEAIDVESPNDNGALGR